MHGLTKDLSGYGDLALEGAVRSLQDEREEIRAECERIHAELGKRALLDRQAQTLAEMEPAVRDAILDGGRIPADVQQRMKKYSSYRTVPDAPKPKGTRG